MTNPNSLSLNYCDLKLQAKSESEGEGQRTFEMVAYTGDAMSVGWPFPVVVSLSGLDATNKSRPILLNHDTGKIVGHTTEVTVGEDVAVGGVISGVGSFVDDIVALSDNGFPWQASVGLSVRDVQFLKPGKTKEVNGRSIEGPAYIVNKSSLGEVSFVPLGADDNSSAQISANWKAGDVVAFNKSIKRDKEKAKAKKIEASARELESKGKEEDVKEEIEAGAGDNLTAEQEAIKSIRASASSEVKRITSLREVCEGHGDIEAKAIEEGWTVEQAELACLRKERASAPAAHSSDVDVSSSVIEAAICLNGGSSGVEKYYDEKTLDAAHKQYKGQIGLQEILLDAARSNGFSGRFRDSTKGVLQAAFSSLALPGILSNVANKFLLDGFNGVETTWRSIAAIGRTNDFKTMTSYRMSGDFKFEEVAPDGELKHAAIGEKSYTNKAETHGKMFSITRQDIINDDLGALTDIPKMLGRGAALQVNTVFWKTFLGDPTFFSAANNNYQAGAATALSVDSLTTAETLFHDQVDDDGNPIAIDAKYLLVPNALSVPARELMNSTEVRQDGNASKSKYGTTNVHAGKMEVLRTSYLSSQNIPNGSTKAWYELADPNDIPTIQVVFLNGIQNPTVESADADFNTLGIQMRGFFDFGVALQDPRGGIKSKGQA